MQSRLFEIDGTTLVFAPSEHNSKWYCVMVQVHLMNDHDDHYYAWVPFDMTSSMPENEQDAASFVPDALHFVNATMGATVVQEPDYD